jgi:hypothetical protein
MSQGSMTARQVRKAIETRLWLLLETAARDNQEQVELALGACTEDILRLCRKNSAAVAASGVPF